MVTIAKGTYYRVDSGKGNRRFTHVQFFKTKSKAKKFIEKRKKNGNIAENPRISKQKIKHTLKF